MGKKITDLTLRDDVTDSCNIPTDDTIQTYRITAAQLWAYIYSKIIAVVTISATGTDIEAENKIVLLDPTGAAFTQNLPAAGDCEGWLVTFKNISTGANAATLDADGSELIDTETTLALLSMESATLYCDGAQWFIV